MYHDIEYLTGYDTMIGQARLSVQGLVNHDFQEYCIIIFLNGDPYLVKSRPFEGNDRVSIAKEMEEYYRRTNELLSKTLGDHPCQI